MFLEVLGPTFLLVAIGHLLGRWGMLPAEPFAKLSFWLLSPALIFETLRSAKLPAREASIIVLFVLVHYGIMFFVSWPLGRKLFPTDPHARRAVSLLLTFGNCGSLGLPILLFAYGPKAVDVGVIFLATNIVLLASLGVGIATWHDRLNLKELSRQVLLVPWPYAVALALMARLSGFWPEVLSRASGLLSQATIPVFLLLLGLELSSVDLKTVAKPAVLVALARLALASLLAWLLAPHFTGDPLIRRSLIVEGSVPSAVNAYILATKYRHRPDLASTALLISTLISPGTLYLNLFLLARFG